MGRTVPSHPRMFDLHGALLKPPQGFTRRYPKTRGKRSGLHHDFPNGASSMLSNRRSALCYMLENNLSKQKVCIEK